MAMGAVPGPVNVSSVESLANIPYMAVNATLAPGATASTTHATYSIAYTLASSASSVGKVVESYDVTPDQVSISYALSDYNTSQVSGLVVRLPAFLTDGERNTTYTVDSSANALQVSLPGDAVSGLNTTCATYQVNPGSGGHVTWSEEPVDYYCRNGYMRSIVATISGSHTAQLTILPHC